MIDLALVGKVCHLWGSSILKKSAYNSSGVSVCTREEGMSRAEKRRKQRENQKKLHPNKLNLEQRTRLQKALDLFKENELEKSFLVTTDLLKEYKLNSQILNLHGVIATALGNYLEAEKSLKEAVQISPKNHKFLNNLGNLHFKQKQYEEALLSFQRAKLNAPDNIQIQINIGQVWEKKEEFEEALKTYQSLSTQYPRNFQVCCLLAQLYHKINATEEAIEAYKECLSIDPSHKESQTNLLNILDKEERWDEINHYFKENTSNENICEKAFRLFKQKNFQEAAPLYEKYLEKTPDSLEAVLNLSNCYEEIGQVQKAITLLEKNLPYETQSTYALALHLNLAKTYYTNKDYQKSLALLLKIHQILPENKEVLKLLGKNFQETLEVENELTCLECILNKEQDEETLYRLYDLLWELGLYEKLSIALNKNAIFSQRNHHLDLLAIQAETCETLSSTPLDTLLQNTTDPKQKAKLLHSLGTIEEITDGPSKAFHSYSKAHQLMQEQYYSLFHYLSIWKKAQNDIPVLPKLEAHAASSLLLLWSPDTYTLDSFIFSISAQSKQKLLDISQSINAAIDYMQSIKLSYPKQLADLDEKHVYTIRSLFPEDVKGLIKSRTDYALHFPLLKLVYPQLKVIHLKDHPLRTIWHLFRQENHIGLFPEFSICIQLYQDMQEYLKGFSFEIDTVSIEEFWANKESYIESFCATLSLDFEKNMHKLPSEFHPDRMGKVSTMKDLEEVLSPLIII